MKFFDIYISNIEAYYQYFNLMKNFIQMFNNVNKSYVLQHKFKNETGRVPRYLLIDADTSEDVLEKLTVGKLKCEIKYKKMVEHAKEKEKKKIH